VLVHGNFQHFQYKYRVINLDNSLVKTLKTLCFRKVNKRIINVRFVILSYCLLALVVPSYF